MAKRMSCSEDPVPCTSQYRTAGQGESVRPFAVRSRPAVRATRNAPEYARSGSLYGHSKREFDALMRKVKLRQDTVRTLPYLGERNSQCICWDDEIPASACASTRRVVALISCKAAHPCTLSAQS